MLSGGCCTICTRLIFCYRDLCGFDTKVEVWNQGVAFLTRLAHPIFIDCTVTVIINLVACFLLGVGQLHADELPLTA